jgi:hypothetical protein
MPVTKSRIARVLALASAWPAAALAEPPVTAEETVSAYDQWYEEVTGTSPRATGALGRCRRGAQDDDIVVCGRAQDDTYRVPYEPVPGQVHHIAGELPSATAAMGADHCLRLCEQPVMIPILPAIQALGRGLDRILHPY